MIWDSFKRITAVFFLASALGAAAAAAQVPASPSNLTITSSASTPAPGQQITITAQSYTSNIDASTVTWTANGKVIQKGVGLTTLDFKTPALGKKVTIVVIAATPQGNQTSGSIIINPSAIDLIVETDGSAPPTLISKVSPAYQNTVTVIAVPHLTDPSGVEYDPKNLIYTWRKDDGTVIKDQSGYGKQAVSLKGDLIPRPYSIIVSVTSRDGTAQGQSVIDITPQTPSVLFYQKDPLYGPLYNIALPSAIHIGAQKETTVLAAPLGFNGGLSYGWSTNNNSHPELSSNSSITLRAPDNQSGVSDVGLDLSSPNNILQQTKGLFTAAFDTTGKGASNASSVAF